jgi:hypothetical protein
MLTVNECERIENDFYSCTLTEIVFYVKREFYSLRPPDPQPAMDLQWQLIPPRRAGPPPLAGLRQEHTQPNKVDCLARGESDQHREPAGPDAALRGARLARN